MHPEPESETPAETQQPSSFFQRLTNIFVSPGEVFDEVRASPVSHKNWLVPLFLSIFVGIAFVMIAFSQQTILREVRDGQTAKIQAKVDEGSMSQEDADRVIEQMQSAMKPGIIKIFGSVGVVFGTVFMFCFTAFLLWLLAKWPLRASIPYAKATEVIGLSTMINVLGALVTLFLVMIKGSMYVNLGPSLLLGKIDPLDNVHQILMALNLVQLWFMGVLSIGLARVSGTATGKCAGLIFGLWAAYKIVTIFLF